MTTAVARFPDGVGFVFDLILAFCFSTCWAESIAPTPVPELSSMGSSSSTAYDSRLMNATSEKRSAKECAGSKEKR